MFLTDVSVADMLHLRFVSRNSDNQFHQSNLINQHFNVDSHVTRISDHTNKKLMCHLKSIRY